jgi:hypothetical protein
MRLARRPKKFWRFCLTLATLGWGLCGKNQGSLLRCVWIAQLAAGRQRSQARRLTRWILVASLSFSTLSTVAWGQTYGTQPARAPSSGTPSSGTPRAKALKVPEVKFNLLETSMSKVMQRTLRKESSFSWSNQPLSEGLAELAKNYKINIWLDRRLDPNQEVTFAPERAAGMNATLAMRFERLGEAIQAQVGVIENVLYFGPIGETERIQRAAVQVHDAISQLDGKLGNESRQLSWAELSTPQSLLANIAKEWSVEIEGSVEHDLMHAGQLQNPTSLATQLAIVAGGFGFEAELTGNRQFRLITMAKKSLWKANYAKSSIDSAAFSKLRTNFPGSQMQQSRSNIVSLIGPTNFHLEMFAMKAGRSSVEFLDRNWTFEFEAPTSAIVDELARNGGEFEWDAACTAEQRARRQTLKADSISTRDLLKRICDGADLSFTIEGEKIRLAPKSKPQ